MDVTVYSVFMAIVWFSVFAVLFSYLRRKNSFIGAFSVWPLLLLCAVCVLRAVCAFELPGARVVRSYTIYPFVQDVLFYRLAEVSGREVTVLSLLLIIWAAGSTVQLVTLAVLYAASFRMLSKLPNTANERLAGIARSVCGAESNVKLVCSNHVKVPMVAGFFRPVIFFPSAELEDGFVENALRHEMSHFKHKDAWAKLLIRVICCLLWWNPLVYPLERDLDHALEIKCDRDVVSKLPVDRRLSYFESIQDFYMMLKSGGASALPVGASGVVSAKNNEQIIQRFEVGLSYDGKKTGRLASAAIIAALIAALLLSYAFILQPAGMPDPFEDGVENFSMTPENSYLVDNGDGTYSLYVDGNYAGQPANIEEEPYPQFEIRKVDAV